MEESSTPLNVLCLEDVLKDAEVITENLIDAGYLVIVDIVAEEKEYVAFLNDRKYDIILADYTLPGFDALAALKLARELQPEVPFICVSGTIGEERAVELLKQGATDYVIKDRLGRLAFAVRRALEGAAKQKEWKKAENALNELSQFNVQLVKSAQEGIIVYDRNLVYQVWNPYMEKLTGLPSSEVIGKHPMDLFPFLKEVGVIGILEKALKGEIEKGVEFPYSLSSGKIGWAFDTTAPLFNVKGEIIGAIGTIRDITEKKQEEQALLISKGKAEESDRLKSAFLANMSHEIRTPMNGILGFAGLLKEPGLSREEQQKYIGIIEKSGIRMLNIINDIIDISKIESGLMEVNLKESNINEQIEDVYAFFKQEVEGKGMQLFFKNSLPAIEAIIKTDPEKLYAILTNLVKNAIKYSEKGSIEFGYDLTATQHAALSESMQFFVKDTGTGIPQDRQKAIFERFIQVDIADKHAYQGAGLGLSISKSYVEMLGGKIWVESEPGKGSIFYFTLPYNSKKQNKNAITNVVSAEVAENKIKKLKMLIADDDETSEILISIAIKPISSKVLKVTTGVEAIEACRNNPDIDLVLMDMQMPILNGYDATRQIRQFNRDVIIIAQTAYGLSGDREKAIDAGCNDYIAKPLNLSVLKSLIQKYLNK